MKIYLASPYSHQDRAERFDRYIRACRAAADLMQAGLQVFSPIAHSHAMGEFMPQEVLLDFDFWMHQDLTYIRDWADEVWVLTLPGHSESRGVAREVNEAQTLGKPVKWVEPKEIPALALAARWEIERQRSAAAFAKNPFEREREIEPKAAEKQPAREWIWCICPETFKGNTYYALTVSRIGFREIVRDVFKPASDAATSPITLRDHLYHFGTMMLLKSKDQLGITDPAEEQAALMALRELLYIEGGRT